MDLVTRRAFPGLAPRAFLFDAFSVVADTHPGDLHRWIVLPAGRSRGSHPGLSCSTLSASSPETHAISSGFNSSSESESRSQSVPGVGSEVEPLPIAIPVQLLIGGLLERHPAGVGQASPGCEPRGIGFPRHANPERVEQFAPRDFLFDAFSVASSSSRNKSGVQLAVGIRIEVAIGPRSRI